jgi:hypothetical protein
LTAIVFTLSNNKVPDLEFQVKCEVSFSKEGTISRRKSTKPVYVILALYTEKRHLAVVTNRPGRCILSECTAKRKPEDSKALAVTIARTSIIASLREVPDKGKDEIHRTLYRELIFPTEEVLHEDLGDTKSIIWQRKIATQVQCIFHHAVE